MQVFFGDCHGITVGYPGIAGKEKQIPCQAVGRAVWGYLDIPYFLETFPAQCLWRLDGLFREDIMLEHEPLGMTFLIGFPARLLDNCQVMTCGINGMSFLVKDEILIIVDELLGELPESQILCLELGFNEFTHGTAGIVVCWICPFGPVYPDTALHFIPDGIQHFHQGHLDAHAALKGILDGSGIKISLSFQKGVECGIDVKQQPVDFGIGFNGLPAFAVQPAFAGIPQSGSTGELAAELRHRPVHGDTSHYRGFARLVQSALFEVEQNLEFFYFHTLIILVANLPVLQASFGMQNYDNQCNISSFQII